MTKKLRLAAGCAALVFVLFLVCSAFLSCFLFAHDCCGDDCPVCLCISHSRDTLRLLCLCVCAVLSANAVLCLCRAVSAGVFSCSEVSLVSLKVKLSD